MCAARSPIVSALLKQYVDNGFIRSTCRNGSRLRHRKEMSTSSSNSGVTKETVMNHALINNQSKSIKQSKTVSDFQELYEATKKKFQCKP